MAQHSSCTASSGTSVWSQVSVFVNSLECVNSPSSGVPARRLYGQQIWRLSGKCLVAPVWGAAKLATIGTTHSSKLSPVRLLIGSIPHKLSMTSKTHLPRPFCTYFFKWRAKNRSNWAISSNIPRKFSFWDDPNNGLSPLNGSPLSPRNSCGPWHVPNVSSH